MQSRTPESGRKCPYGISRCGSSSVSSTSPSATSSRKRSPPRETSVASVAGPGAYWKRNVGGSPRPPMPSGRLISRTGRSGAREAPVALAHVAHQDRVRGEVHRVHLGELRLAEQRAGGRHQRGRERVALGPVAVALGHQAGGGGQRQAPEAPVLGDRAEVRRVRAVAAVAQHPLGAELHPRVLDALLAPTAAGRSRTARPRPRSARRPRPRARPSRRGAAPPGRARRPAVRAPAAARARRRGCPPWRSSRSRTPPRAARASASPPRPPAPTRPRRPGTTDRASRR